MRSKAPIKEPAGESWTPEWCRFFENIFIAATGWNKSMTATATLNFGLVSANAELAGPSTVAVTGARAGDRVLIQAASNTVGIDYKGFVTADDTVTIYAINYTVGAINPASMDYRIIVLQN